MCVCGGLPCPYQVGRCVRARPHPQGVAVMEPGGSLGERATQVSGPQPPASHLHSRRQLWRCSPVTGYRTVTGLGGIGECCRENLYP